MHCFFSVTIYGQTIFFVAEQTSGSTDAAIDTSHSLDEICIQNASCLL